MNKWTEDLSPALGEMLRKAALPPASGIQALSGGGNNKVFRIEAGDAPLLLKLYFRHPGDTRDRLTAEFAFLRFAWEQGLRQVPQPLAADFERGLGLYEFCAGRKLQPGEVAADAVQQACDFCVALNRQREQGRSLPDASEACFTLAAHLECVDRRLQRLETDVTADTELDRQAQAFVRQEVLPAWQGLRQRIEQQAQRQGLDLQRPLDAEASCVSPSDFGFHNALRDETGRLRFLDFEYSGWDDPAKLVCDFFCQPAVPVPLSFYNTFVDRLSAELSSGELLRARSDLLLPVYQMKWVTILLNEFLPVGDRRRRFAQPGVDWEVRRRQQLEKARDAFCQNQDR